MRCFEEGRQMTPNQQQIVDAILTVMQRRVSELVDHCQQGRSLSEQPLEQLRTSPLGEHLAAIAHYAEAMPTPTRRMCAARWPFWRAASLVIHWRCAGFACLLNGNALR
jgi:hypothetical protein